VITVCFDFDDFFDDLDIEDFAWIGGGISMVEEEAEERKRREDDYDVFNPPDGDPYP
jgi:hypothetical protein